jgi:hypothetical protein
MKHVMAASGTLNPDAAGWFSKVWLRWVLANLAGEGIGFGLTMLIGIQAAGTLASLASAALFAAMLAMVLLVGILEGAAVGSAQWLVLRRILPGLPLRAWAAATMVGAIVAWGVGMALGSLAGDRLEAATEGFPLLPALMIGMVAGSILSCSQWVVLRPRVARAGWWVPAHAAAWAVGMAVAFAGLRGMTEELSPVAIAVVAAGTALAVGFIVAATTGVVLVLLVGSGAPETVPPVPVPPRP